MFACAFCRGLFLVSDTSMASYSDEECSGIVSKLPQAEALPDGFTEGSSDEQSCSHENGDRGLTCQLPEAEALPDGFSEGSEEPFSVKENAAMFSHLSLASPATVEDGSASEPMKQVPVDMRDDKIGVKLRRFPVALSEAESSPSDAEQAEANQSSMHGPALEPAVLVTSERRGTSDLSTKPRKRRAKEVKALMSATDKTSDEKLQLLHTKYLQQVADTEQLDKELLLMKLKLLESNKERESLCSDMNKSVMLRLKLESLCRELQRQHKVLSDESRRVALEEHQKRQELSAKFHNTIQEISSKLEEQGDDRIRQAKENEILRDKLKQFTQQYEIREEHYNHQLKTKSLEHQLLEVKLKQQQELCAQEDAKARMYTEQISQLLVTEQDLRSQLALYGDKFEQFQETLTKSNEVFASFKQEMEKMSKTIKTLEKENFALKKKTQKSDVSMIELLDERSVLKKQLETTTNQKKKLEALCRSLQAERKQHLLPSAPSGSSQELSQEET